MKKKLIGQIKIENPYVVSESKTNEIIYSLHVPIIIDSKIIESG
jgi:hypothetical protein